jgi:hypothetical protein
MSLQERQFAFEKELEALQQKYGLRLSPRIQNEQFNDATSQQRAVLGLAEISDWKPADDNPPGK